MAPSSRSGARCTRESIAAIRCWRGVPGITMNADLKNRILGEARFLRAIYYFYLVNIYGPVPVLTEPKNADQLQITQSASSVGL